jgi:thymidylate synthase
MKNIFILLIGLCLSIQHSQVFAEYNSEKIAEGIGSYAMATDLLNKVSSSRCGYILRGEYSIEKVIEEVLPYLTKEDQKEIKKFFEGQFFKEKAVQNKKDVEDAILIGELQGLNLNEICKKINSNATRVYKYSFEQWEHAKKSYSK